MLLVGWCFDQDQQLFEALVSGPVVVRAEVAGGVDCCLGSCVCPHTNDGMWSTQRVRVIRSWLPLLP